MIIVCPACGRRYRIDKARLAAGMRLRCSGCKQVFDSRPPASVTRSRAEGPAAHPAPPQSPTPVTPQDGRPLVLIGDINRPFRETAQSLLQSLGCLVETSEQGEAVFRAAVNRRPALLLLNSRLPGLSGIAVCEGVKGSPHLKSIKVVLVNSTVHPPDVGQATRSGFEPDDQFEDTISEQDLQARLAQLLGRGVPAAARRDPKPVPMQSAPRPPSPAPAPAQATQAVIPLVPAREGTPAVDESEPRRPAPVKEIDPRDALDPAAEIQRLARIMLSDLKLYNPDKFATAVNDGRLLEIFRSELIRGKDLITSRFPDLPDRMALLTTALRQGIEEEISAAGTNS
jgi:predicted Zn finger-like uncharacterized protein